MESFDKLLLENKAWAEEKMDEDSTYFDRMYNNQSPKFLWIGCSDSRVAVNEITNTAPGDIFVHRNIANLVIHTDLNVMSVLQYAVEVLKVEDIIVCGHDKCGGIKAALDNKDLGLINKWLRSIKDTYVKHKSELAILEEEKKLNRLTELNVIEQAKNLSKTTIVQKSWHKSNSPIIHGCIYDMKEGIIREICRLDKDMELEPVFRYTFED